MRLGGFVIHGNNADTLGDCLGSLLAVCEDVVAVDSGSTDGSAELVRSRGVRAVAHPWEGYGAARLAGARALAECDYLLFLDSDEWLAEDAIQALRRFKESRPEHPHYLLPRRDWADLPGGRFLFRTQWHVRLMRPAAAAWEPWMIVHETPRAKAPRRYPSTVEHRYATSLARRLEKEERYALLWALLADREGKRRKAAWPQRCAHLLRNAVVKGAAFRGGGAGVRLAWQVAQYHARKYEYLARVQRGHYPELVAALRDGRLRELFSLVEAAPLLR